MTDKEVLLDLLYCIARMFYWTLDDLAQDVLHWQPDQEAIISQ